MKTIEDLDHAADSSAAWRAGFLRGRAMTRDEVAADPYIADAERRRHWMKADMLREAAVVEEVG